MKYLLNFLPEVEADVKSAYHWYEEQVIGLGEEFLLATDAAIHLIHRNPLQFEVIYKGIRKCKTKRFPFGIFYLQKKDVITVLAIVHLARHPKTWKARSKGK
jgi:hypothetical protein